MSSMLESLEMLQHIEAAWKSGKRTALVMITDVKGSAYRRPGTKMMMAEDNQMWGTISGGCLEGDVYQWAERAMAQDEPRIQVYDLTENDMWGLGIGCKGVVEVWIRPLTDNDPFWAEVRRQLERRRPLTLALAVPAGAQSAVDPDGRVFGDPIPPELQAAIQAHRASATRLEKVTVAGATYVIDSLLPPDPLVVAGAGHDAVPVVTLASSVGFAVTVLDPRPAFNGPDRFSSPETTFLVQEADAVDPAQLADRFWVIMNHHQARDEAALKLALDATPRWIGVLGPLSRTREMMEKIGRTFEDGPIWAPVGLDLGAETPEEVAVSIVAQLMAERRGRGGAPLAGREKIHR